MSLACDQRREWFEGFAMRRLGIGLFDGVTSIESRREHIRRAISSARLEHAQPGEHSHRTWSDLFDLVYGEPLTQRTIQGEGHDGSETQQTSEA